MTRTRPPAAAPETPTVADLLQQRAQVQGWLDRLDEVRSGVSDRVAQRVRDDYQQRLREVLEALAARRDALLEECRLLGERLAAVEAELEQASDALDEARLRSRIGELPEDEWAQLQPSLEGAVESARAQRDSTRQELDRLTEILSSIDGAAPDAEPREGEPEPVVTGDGLGGEPAATADDRTPSGSDLPPVLLDDIGDDDGSGSFLEELDRALADPDAGDDADEFDPEKRPPAGVKCSDCGYTNDVDAWYCGVCGADLA